MRFYRLSVNPASDNRESTVHTVCIKLNLPNVVALGTDKVDLI